MAKTTSARVSSELPFQTATSSLPWTANRIVQSLVVQPCDPTAALGESVDSWDRKIPPRGSVGRMAWIVGSWHGSPDQVHWNTVLPTSQTFLVLGKYVFPIFDHDKCFHMDHLLPTDLTFPG